MKKIFFVFISLFLLSHIQILSQDLFRLNVDTISSTDLLFQEVEDTLMIDKKKKKKRNVYFGIKTKKGFIRSSSGRNLIYENFHYIKEPEIKNEYAQEIYFYDKKKKKIIRSKKIIDDAVMMHGPYKKRLGEQIIEEGMFYYGLKQNRWVRLNRADILQDKEIFSLGWYYESIRSFWDRDKKNLRDIIPIKFGEKNGVYYAFYENGTVAAKGEYEFDKPVGIWTEYYNSGKKKREIKYEESAFNFSESFISKEWNINGKLIYDRNLFLKE